jgi:hypothetical protein
MTLKLQNLRNRQWTEDLTVSIHLLLLVFFHFQDIIADIDLDAVDFMCQEATKTKDNPGKKGNCVDWPGWRSTTLQELAECYPDIGHAIKTMSNEWYSLASNNTTI